MRKDELAFWLEMGGVTRCLWSAPCPPQLLYPQKREGNPVPAFTRKHDGGIRLRIMCGICICIYIWPANGMIDVADKRVSIYIGASLCVVPKIDCTEHESQLAGF
jgi:hypothetical protein